MELVSYARPQLQSWSPGGPTCMVHFGGSPYQSVIESRGIYTLFSPTVYLGMAPMGLDRSKLLNS